MHRRKTKLYYKFQFFRNNEKKQEIRDGKSEAASKSDQSGPELRAASRRYSNKSNGVPEEKG